MTMKRLSKKLMAVLMLCALMISCNEPETLLTNIVRPDGSVIRRITMKLTGTKFEKSSFQVPFDTTWTVRDTIETDPKGDTMIIRTAEKVFANAGEINKSYLNDSSVNGKLSRFTNFKKKFRWFNTEYRFSETIDSRIPGAYPVSNFLDKEELVYFYSPENLRYSREHGPDSLKFKLLAGSIEEKTMDWMVRNMTSLWISNFTTLTAGKAGPDLSYDHLKSMERDIDSIIKANSEIFDSLWSEGTMLKMITGKSPDAERFKTEADSALSMALNTFIGEFGDYSVSIVMPGRLTATNGFPDSTRQLVWPVSQDFFLTDRYEMWAESKTPNVWAWIVTGLFILFVAAGLLIKKSPAGRRD